MSESASVRLRRSINDTKLLLMPGGFSTLAVRMAESLGFESFFLAGSQTSGHIYGVPDIALIGRKEMAEAVRNIAAVSSMPVLVDSDTGYGNAVNVYHATEGYIRAGAAGLHLEDQLAPKLSGTAAGQAVHPRRGGRGPSTKAAVAARDALDPDFVICARCDFIGAEGGDFEGAVERCIRYKEEANVDLIWLNNVQNKEEVHEAAERIPGAVMPTFGGAPPGPTLEELQAWGVAVAIFPALTSSVGCKRCGSCSTTFASGALSRWTSGGKRRRRASGGRCASMTSCTRTRRWCARSRTATCRRNRSGTMTPHLGITHRRRKGLAGPLTPERSSPRNAIMSATVVISVT